MFKIAHRLCSHAPKQLVASWTGDHLPLVGRTSVWIEQTDAGRSAATASLLGSGCLGIEHGFKILNVRSVMDDKTTAARIRDAAIARFPVDGLNGTTIRAVAADAGVSPGLVIHHFGSKEGLHRDCDDYVVGAMTQMKRESLAQGAYRRGDSIASIYKMALPLVRYIAWTVGNGGETAARIFDELVDEAVQLFEEGKETGTIGEVHGDPRKQAAVLVAMQFATLVFHEHLSRVFGLDMLSVEGLAASAPYTLQIFSGDLFDREVMSQTKKALQELETAQKGTQ